MTQVLQDLALTINGHSNHMPNVQTIWPYLKYLGTNQAHLKVQALCTSIIFTMLHKEWPNPEG